MIRNRLQWLNTMVTEPYYFFHFLLFFSYLPIRISSSSFFPPHISHHILRREIQAFLAFSILTFIKMVREETWEGFIADALLFGKAFLFLLALYVDYHLALWYMLAFLVLYIVTQQPAFPALGAVNSMTPLQLESTLIEGNTSKFWLVEFRTLCSSTCVRLSRNFPELSVTYANKHLSFGLADLGLFPNVAEKFGISLTGNVGLPTYILFENNSEIARFPGVDFVAKGFHPPITKANTTQFPHGFFSSCIVLKSGRVAMARMCDKRPNIMIVTEVPQHNPKGRRKYPIHNKTYHPSMTDMELREHREYLARHFDLDRLFLEYLNSK